MDFFASSPDPNFQEVAKRMIVPKTWGEYNDLLTDTRLNGGKAEVGAVPTSVNSTEEWFDWYRGTEKIPGDFPFLIHLLNKKWPLQEVHQSSKLIQS